MSQRNLTSRIMKSMRAGIALLLPALSVVAASAGEHIVEVAGFPSAEPGYSLGVSACYAGRIGDYIIMAGGCNFPEAGKPKKYYAGVYAARIDRHLLQWHLVGRLPEPAAYGGTVQTGDSLLFIGGNNSQHGLKTVYSIHLGDVESGVRITRLADLPYAVDNMAVARMGKNVFVVGGNQDGKPSASVLCLSLDKPRAIATANAENAYCPSSSWRELTAVPGKPRVQPVATARDNKLYVWGGFFANGENSVVHTGGYSFDMDRQEWEEVAAPYSTDGEEMTLSGGVAWAEGNCVLATGGVNKDMFLDAISGRYELVRHEDYLKKPIGWYKFNGNLYEYDATADKWIRACSSPRLARAGAQAVPTSVGTFYIGGELKPALRTPQIVIIGAEPL